MTTTEIRIPKMPAEYLPELSPVGRVLLGDTTTWRADQIRAHYLRVQGYTGWIDHSGYPTDLAACDACNCWFEPQYAKDAACASATFCPTCMADHETECRRCADPGE